MDLISEDESLMMSHEDESLILSDYKTGNYQFKDLAETYKLPIEIIYKKIINQGEG